MTEATASVENKTGLLTQSQANVLQHYQDEAMNIAPRPLLLRNPVVDLRTEARRKALREAYLASTSLNHRDFLPYEHLLQQDIEDAIAQFKTRYAPFIRDSERLASLASQLAFAKSQEVKRHPLKQIRDLNDLFASELNFLHKQISENMPDGEGKKQARELLLSRTNLYGLAVDLAADLQMDPYATQDEHRAIQHPGGNRPSSTSRQPHATIMASPQREMPSDGTEVTEPDLVTIRRPDESDLPTLPELHIVRAPKKKRFFKLPPQFKVKLRKTETAA